MNNNTKIKDYKALARQQLMGNYGIIIGSDLLTSMIASALATLCVVIFLSAVFFARDKEFSLMALSSVFLTVVAVITLLSYYLFSLGRFKQCINTARRGSAEFGDVFYAFKKGSRPFRYVAVCLLIALILIVPSLIMLLIIVVGGVKLFSLAVSVTLLIWYAFYFIYVFYVSLKYYLALIIAVDKPHIKAFAALKRSAKLMRGKKLKLLLMMLSFIPWIIPFMMTLGFASLWIVPYIRVSFCVFYLEQERRLFPHESYGEATTESSDAYGNHSGTFSEASSSVHTENVSAKDMDLGKTEDKSVGQASRSFSEVASEAGILTHIEEPETAEVKTESEEAKEPEPSEDIKEDKDNHEMPVL